MRELDFRKHPIWMGVASLKDRLHHFDVFGDDRLSQGFIGAIELLEYLANFQGSQEHALFSDSMLDNVHIVCEELNEQAMASLQGRDRFPNLPELMLGQFDVIRERLALWPRSAGNSEAIVDFERAISTVHAELSSRRDEIESTLRGVLRESEARERDLAAQIESLRDQISEANRSAKKLQARIVNDEIRLDAALTANNETFNAGQTAREMVFKEWLNSQESGFESLVTPHLESIATAAAGAVKDSAEVSGLRKGTVEMASLATGDILAGEYGAHAKSERWASYVAYAAGVLAALGSIAIVLLAFGGLSNGMTWPVVTLKLGLTLAAGGIAAVAFRFGGQATRRATSFKRQELELRALQPFLMDVHGADGAKTAFLERAFGHAWVESVPGKSEPEMNDALLKLLTVTIQNATKPGSPSGG